MRTLPPPAFLSANAQQLYQLGIDYLHSQECLYDSSLKPEDWIAAYCAKIVPNFTEQILGALLDSPALDEFASEIVEPSLTAMIPHTFIIIPTAHCQLKKWIGLSWSLATEQLLIPPLPRTI